MKFFHSRNTLIPCLTLMGVLFLFSCDENNSPFRKRKAQVVVADTIPFVNPTLVEDKFVKECPLAENFDFPIGKPRTSGMDTTGYYKARGFLGLEHLGDDWNYQTGGNSDMGHLVYTISDGVVFYAGNLGGGWGNVIRILHNMGTEKDPVYIESVYAHLSNPMVKKGYKIKKGWTIGTMGNADGRYHSHLHFEIRLVPGKDINAGIHGDTIGFVDPTKFILENKLN